MCKSLFFILIVATFAVAQQIPYSSTEPLLTPESSLVLQDGEYTRQLSGAELKQSFDRYEADVKATNGAYVEEVAPEKLNVVIPMAPQAQVALARQEEVFARSAIDLSATVADPSDRATQHEMEIGYNQQWGQQDKFAAYIDALLKIYGSQDLRALDAHCNAGGYVFNYQAKALEFNMAMRSGANPSAHTVLKIFGQTKFSFDGTTVYKKVYFQDEIGKTVRFFIGPVPVSVRGSIGGSAGFEAGIYVVGTGIKGQITPGITSYGKADAGVDLWFVKAGVEGSLDLLIDHLPAAVTVQLLPENSYKTLEMGLNVTNELKALAGKITVFVKVKEFWKFWKDSWKQYNATLFTWSGIQKTWVLLNKSVKIQLG